MGIGRKREREIYIDIYTYTFEYMDLNYMFGPGLGNLKQTDYIERNFASNRPTWAGHGQFFGNFLRTGNRLGMATRILRILWGRHLVAFTFMAVDTCIHLLGYLLLPWHW